MIFSINKNQKKILITGLLIQIFLLDFSSFAQQGLMLGGKFVPKDSIYVYFFLGNSVMSGRDTPADTITNSYAWKYIMTNNCYTYTKPCPPQYSWQSAVDPICFDSKNPLNGVVKSSPGMPFLKRMVKDYPGYYFGIAQLSGSAWQLTHFIPPNSGDLKAFITQGNILKQNCNIAGVVMMFNIVEIQYSNGDSNYASIQNYAKNIDSIITYLRKNLDIPNLPLIQTDYPVMAGDPKDLANDHYSLTGPWADAIKALINQNKLASQKIANMALIPTDSLTMYGADGLYTHYSKKAHSIWADRVADTIKARNWGPVKISTMANNNKIQFTNTKYKSMISKKVFFTQKEAIKTFYSKNILIFSVDGKRAVLNNNLQKTSPKVFNNRLYLIYEKK
jgi:hypothetical protein